MVKIIEDKRVTSVVDIPRKDNNTDDYFGIDNYSKGIADFIRYSRTPITIAIQGEWGSGKTSLMNYVHDDLCGPEKKFDSIWLNTWEDSVLVQDRNTLMVIISNILNKTIKAIEQSVRVAEIADDNKSKEQVGKIKKNLNKARDFLNRNMPLVTEVTKFGLGQIGFEATSMIDIATQTLGNYNETKKNEELEQNEDNTRDINNGDIILNIRELRESLEIAICKSLEINPNKKGFIFFIDDLDRLEPSIAVDILEVLKNVFNIEHCIFLIAIDYEVVVKGLKAKFGEMDRKNEREFRFFFDKIIQVPFTMPVTEYKINDFLMRSLEDISYFEELRYEDTQLEKFKQKMSDIVELSVGKNPRALKRLINSLSLLKIINKNIGKNVQESYEEIVFFALVSIQTAYPKIYDLLKTEPCFDKWNKETVNLFVRKNNNNLQVLEIVKQHSEILSWEEVLELICEDIYLERNFSAIRDILKIILEEIPSEKLQLLGNIIQDTLPLTGLTDVSEEVIISQDQTMMSLRRKHQTVFRRNILEVEQKCRICDISNIELLRTGHIKPWFQSSSEERMDINNGIVFCANHDTLFDKGYISFDENGRILISQKLDEESKRNLNINSKITIQVKVSQEKYMKWHRENIFLSNKY
ncbi:P-loop NTPase fold protein [Bacillus toyonensis]